eukprot:CAMPEP_0170451504 /NCGR_PEP_ID=MMETSP0123-20130129/722_1 /TAXON_ID=182087 /ORGANISM="Favella ehrenbergii, Strain Fehren 1" /LENGTH=218 /DNA_ID=CAMNT_0010713215 /DNA_START=301 /DNA_END=958 /DNA_ORIENTATION=-
MIQTSRIHTKSRLAPISSPVSNFWVLIRLKSGEDLMVVISDLTLSKMRSKTVLVSCHSCPYKCRTKLSRLAGHPCSSSSRSLYSEAAVLQRGLALRELPFAQDSLLILLFVPGADVDDRRLRLHLRTEKHAAAPVPYRRLHLPQDHRTVPHLLAAQIQRRWARRRQLHRLHHHPCHVLYHQRLDLLQSLLFIDDNSGNSVRHEAVRGDHWRVVPILLG